MNKAVKIAIIGSGASGTLLAINLLNKLQQAANIYLIEKEPTAFNRGVAYSSSLAYAPLNVVAGKMSIVSDNPDDFVDYLMNIKGEKISSQDFVSRYWFGDYLQHHFKIAYENKHSEVCCAKIQADVSDIRNTADGRLNIYESGELLLTCDKVVLATGNDEPKSLEVQNQFPSHRYFNNPWKFDVAQIEKNSESIFLVGTGLTTIDIVCSLVLSAYKGKIHALSRSGFFPTEHTESHDATKVDPSNFKSLYATFYELRKQIRHQGANGVHWSKILDLLRPHTAELWRGFTDAEKSRFLKFLRPMWDRHRHRMPSSSAAILQSLQSTGTLVVHAGNLKTIVWDSSKACFIISYVSAQGHKEIIEAAYIVNSTGPNADFRNGSNKLLANLIRSGYASPDNFKLGIETRNDGSLVGIGKQIYAIGPLRKASEWESTAIREIIIHANQLSNLFVLGDSASANNVDIH